MSKCASLKGMLPPPVPQGGAHGAGYVTVSIKPLRIVVLCYRTIRVYFITVGLQKAIKTPFCAEFEVRYPCSAKVALYTAFIRRTAVKKRALYLCILCEVYKIILLSISSATATAILSIRCGIRRENTAAMVCSRPAPPTSDRA